jgi:RNA polymerase sigma factor (sigma-70 family)
MGQKAARGHGVSPAELREAERSFKLMLARKFSAAWIADNARDLLGQANAEYAEWLKENPPARKPVGWLMTCAYRRALDLFDSQNRKPRPASLEAVFHLADEATPTPEQQALDHDRHRRLREAMRHLPEKECKLLAMVYFEGMSIREAGRKLGWQKSAADRHHGAAMEKMLSLVGDRTLLSPASLGVAAWVVSKGEDYRPWLAPVKAAAEVASEGVALGAEAATVGAHRLGDLGRRLGPFSDAPSAAATGSASGAGRVVGMCAGGFVALACGLGATGVVGPGVSSVDAERPKPAKPRVAKPTRTAPAPVVRKAAPPPPTPAPAPREPETASTSSAGQAQPTERPEPEPTYPPVETGRGTVSEFGLGGEASETEPSPAPESSTGEGSSPTPAPAPKETGDPAAREVGL